MLLKLTAFLGLLAAVNTASDCGLIDRVPDINCDRSLIISVIGDSLVFGFGDTEKGGYVTRLQRQLKAASVNNFGKRGMFSRDLVRLLTGSFKKPEDTLGQTLFASDVVVIDVGRNDRWFFGPPIATYRNLKRAANMIRTKVAQTTGNTPYVVIAVLMLPNRGSQGPWVRELNNLILAGNSKSNPSDLRFDLVSKRLLGPDQIHPTSQGYKALEAVLYKYLTMTLPANLLK